MLEDLDKMMQAALSRIESTLDTRHVVGDPVIVGDYTIIPLISIGFGVGVGSGSGKADEFIKGEGSGGAAAAGGGLKPVAVVVIGPDGARVEHIKGSTASLLESLAASAGNRRTKTDETD